MHVLANRKRKAMLLILSLCGSLWLGGGTALGVSNNWQQPAMGDYVKIPEFIGYSVRPNVMIILDTSDSMNYNAYGAWPGSGRTVTGSPFEGEPYVTSLSFPITSNYDDMEERKSDGNVHDSSVLDIGVHLVGLRFRNVKIPQGATVTSAHIYFTADASNNEDCTFTIAAENTGHADPIATSTNNLSNRPATASVTWTPDPWESDENNYSTPDLSGIVNQIVARPDWSSGNAILFLIDGETPKRAAEPRNAGSGYAPVLRITYGGTNATRYYGYFNPDYFYKYTGGVFQTEYEKGHYDTDHWVLKDGTLLTDTQIVANGLWDGNWLNWLCMRRIDVLRKVLFGGDTKAARDGDGDQILYGEADSANNWYKWFDSSSKSPVSPHDGNYQYRVRNGKIIVSGTEYYIRVRKRISNEPEEFFRYDNGDNLAGILQRIGDRARWGNIWFRNGGSPEGGWLQNPIGADVVKLVTDLEAKDTDMYTPLAETFYTAMQYFKQEGIALSNYSPNFPNTTKGDADDPYYIKNDDGNFVPLPCAKSFVLLLTDGASTMDSVIPTIYQDYDQDGKDAVNCTESSWYSNCDYQYGGTDFPDDIALYARRNDLRTDEGMDGVQNLFLYPVYAFGNDDDARNLLMDAARNGGFEDLDGDDWPDGAPTDPPEKRLEWDKDGDYIPDNYFEASDGFVLEVELKKAVDKIIESASSGTAASVVSNSRSGEGALYQSIFYPSLKIDNKTIQWAGQVHALFVDDYGNLREDTNDNRKLDLKTDMFIEYAGEYANKYTDDNGDGIFDDIEKYKDANNNGIIDPEELAAGPSPDATVPLSKLHYLWNSSTWLNEMSDATTQRNYTSADNRRYIFTFVDADGDMVNKADGTERKDFALTTDPEWDSLISPSNFPAYIHSHEPFNAPAVPAVTTAEFKQVVSRKIRRIVNWIRGEDQGTDSVGSIELTPLRSRKIDYDQDGTEETWRLGDIVFSTPILVERPAEDFDLIYRDNSYQAFYRKYKNRRNVIYVGANDGMLHAFNSGFFDTETSQFLTRPLGDPDPVSGERNPIASYTPHQIGAELWAYVPYNLLPHLYWLTKPDYRHVYYVDLEPRVFDANIFANDDAHPNGWGTVLVAGMRFGGGKIAADIDKSDGAYSAAKDKVMSSAFAIFDITDPEAAPKLLAEVTFPELGFTTCHPGVIPWRPLSKNLDGKYMADNNDWFLIFGSGPASRDAFAVNGANNDALNDGISTQQAVMYALDLKTLAQEGKVVTRTGTGLKTFTAATAADPFYLVQFSEEKSYVSKPISVDWDRDFITDVVYFGTSSGDHGSAGWGGKMRRLVITPSESSNTFTSSTVAANTLIDLSSISFSEENSNGQPITSPATASIDKENRRWVFFGTGRFYATWDKLNLSDQQSYYGIKEPVDSNGDPTYGEVSLDGLTDVTNDLISSANDLWTLSDDIVLKDGWRMDFKYAEGERNLGQAVLSGEVLLFTTYIPGSDICSNEGESAIYALYYGTGTSHYKSILGGNLDKVRDLGKGLTLTPNIQVGRGKTRAFIQKGDSSIEDLPIKTPAKNKSSDLLWRSETWECP